MFLQFCVVFIVIMLQHFYKMPDYPYYPSLSMTSPVQIVIPAFFGAGRAVSWHSHVTSAVAFAKPHVIPPLPPMVSWSGDQWAFT